MNPERTGKTQPPTPLDHSRHVITAIEPATGLRAPSDRLGNERRRELDPNAPHVASATIGVKSMQITKYAVRTPPEVPLCLRTCAVRM